MSNIPKLTIALMHDYAARDFVDSGVLEELSKNFDLSFISTDRLDIDIEDYGTVYHYIEPTGFRLRLVQLGRGLWHVHDKGKFELNREQALARATFGLSPSITNVIKFIASINMSYLVSIVIRQFLRMTFKETLPSSFRPDAFLVYTSVSSYFADDLIREAHSKDIPLLALVNNWDNLNTKAFFERPPYLGVWGEQGFLIARLMHLIPSHKIFVIGSPRFEIYRRLCPTRSEARAYFGLPDQGRVLLFCGSGVAFEESSLIHDLEKAIQDGILPKDTLVLYKPHPYRFLRNKEATLDFAGLKNIRLVSSQRKLSELSLYPYLMACVDGIISPFSTMVLEGAHAGLPALCLGYNDPLNTSHDWNRVAFNLHLYIIRHGDWAVICDNKEQFVQECQKLINLIDNKLSRSQAKSAAEIAVKFGISSVSERLRQAVLDVIAGRDADNSYILSLNPAIRADDMMQSYLTKLKD